MIDSAQGRLIWKAPTPKPIPRPVLYLCAFVLLGLGLLIGYAVVDVIRPMRNWLSNPVFYICVVSVLFFLLLGAWTLYCAVNFRRLKGLHFFEHGVEVGEDEERRFVRYVDLEVLKFVLAHADADDKGMKVVHAVASAVTLNPTGFGQALGGLAQKSIYAEIFIKTRNGVAASFPLTRKEYNRLAPHCERS